MKHTHAIDKSGEDPTECDMCGFRNGGHMADCPAAPLTENEIPHNAPRDYSPFAKMGGARMTRADLDRNALTLAYLKATERRFTGEPLTGFGAL